MYAWVFKVLVMSSSISSNKNVHIFAEDMTEEKRKRAIEISISAFKSTHTQGKPFSTIANVIRSDFDKVYGIGWNCVVGKAFGSYVTHEMKTYM